MSTLFPHTAKILLFALLSLADLLLTWWLFRLSGSAAYEWNPVARWLLARHGWLGLTAYKGGLVLAVLALLPPIARHRPRMVGCLLGFACGTLALIVLYSASLCWSAPRGNDRQQVDIGLKREGRNPNAPASVSGNVTYKGARLEAGTLTFQGEGNYATAIGTDGTYSTTDLPIGKMVVTVETESANKSKKVAGAFAAKMYTRMSPKPESARYLPRGKYVRIPSRYADPRTSPLKVTLKDGKNDNTNFDLTD